MGYVGSKPSAVPLTSADITDGIITSAKIADGTIVNADINASAAIASTKLSGVANTPAFHAYNTSTQTVTSDVQTKVTLSTELFDTDNCFDSTTNYRFTPTTAGKYFIYGHIYPDGSSYPYDWSIQIRKNGTSIASSQRDSSANNVYGSIEVSSIMDFNGSTDYVELFGKVRQAGTTIFTGGQGNTFFGGYKIIGV